MSDEGMPAPEMRLTKAVKATWWERWVGKCTGFYPDSFVRRRMDALHADEADYAAICAAWLQDHKDFR